MERVQTSQKEELCAMEEWKGLARWAKGRNEERRLMKQEFGELMCSQAIAKYSDMELEVLHFAELSKEKDFIRGKHVNPVGNREKG